MLIQQRDFNFNKGSSFTKLSDGVVDSFNLDGVQEETPFTVPALTEPQLTLLTQTGSAVAIILALTMLLKALVALVKACQE